MPKGKGEQDPLGNYIEWTQHRYDPGHYLGGTIEPHLRKSSLGRRARRLSGLMLLFSGAMGIALTAMFAYQQRSGLMAISAALPLLTLLAGFSMLTSTKQRKRGSKTRSK